MIWNMSDVNIQSEEFIKGLVHREPRSFRCLFYFFHKRLCLFALKIVKDSCEAEDIVQEVFLAFWKTDIVKFPNLKTIRIFLYNSVQNRCLNYLRDREIQERNYKKLGRQECDEDYILCQQIRADVVAEIFDAINELPEKCREIFTLSYIKELPDKEIAELLQISPNTIKTQKQRAKTFLRTRLGDVFVYVTMFFPGF